jgi:hypothetical protein
MPKAEKSRRQKPSTVIIDLDADPVIPDGWKVESHQKGGQLVFDTASVKLHLDTGQQNGSLIKGNELRKKLTNMPVMNANMLDWYLAHPECIPEEWKGKYVFFWGTIYRNRNGLLCVRYLCWHGGRWNWGCGWLEDDWDADYPAAVRAS